MNSLSAASSAARSNTALRLVWTSAWLLLAATVWWFAWPQQLQRACWMGEWPFEHGCVQTAKGANNDHAAAVFAEHLQHNVGDSRAWAWLVGALWKEGDVRAHAVLPWSVQLAPNHPYVLAVQADVQLQAGQWSDAARTLIALVERGQPRALPVLRQLMVASDSQEAVLAQLDSQSHWLDTVLAGADRQAPVSLLQPFISKGAELGVLKPVTALGLIDRLQAEGAWLEAHALWVAWRGEVFPGLYNAGFDRTALRRGFDWQWPEQPANRRALRVEQVTAAPRAGWMLELRLTGRGALPQPLVSQALVLPGARYRLRGSYMADRLLTKEGLVWALRCAAGGERWAHSEPLKDTQRQWRTFEVEFTPPAACGAAVQLRLETTAAWEAGAGMMGTVSFDDFVLEPMPSVAAAASAAAGTP